MDQLKDREAQLEDDREPTTADESEPAFNVSTEGDRTTIQPTGESRADERRRKWAERVKGVIVETNKPVEDRLTHLQRTLEGLQGAIERARTTQPAAQPAPQAGEGVDPEFRKVRRRQSEIMSILGTVGKAGSSIRSQEDIDRLEEEYYKLDQDALDLRASKLTEQRLQDFSRQHPAPMHPEQQMITSEFSDVIADTRAAKWAALRFRQEEAENEGRPWDRMAAHRRALTEAAEKYKLRRPKLAPADPSTQARFGGAPPASGRGNSSRGPGRPLTKAEEGLAIASAPPGTPVEKAYSDWSAHMLKRDPHYFG
jgi:hypothetical protein